ncbi:conjugal transfer protein TraI [Zhouia sp. PK063]|uniref:conjugal transfer protein TraI n=1 Tax=Zhouia sp. PK063 TaxID=3373602 RepID=UPI0037AC71CF
MKKISSSIVLLILSISLWGRPKPSASPAPNPIAITMIIKAATKKVIKAIDLMIQRLQNKTIWLQNAQKLLENTMSKLHLTAISQWTLKHQQLYQKYYQELLQVKTYITYYHRIKEMVAMQTDMVKAYQKAWTLLHQDQHFTPDELQTMAQVYSGMLEQSANYLDQIYQVIKTFMTSMSDAQRIAIINKAADSLEQLYQDLKQYNRDNMLMSIHRAHSQEEITQIKQYYGLP